MFGKKRNKTVIEVNKLSSLIGDNLHIVGDVRFSGGLRIDGKVEGNVIGQPGEKSLIVLSGKGSIIGRVKAYDAVINGQISGDLEVEHFLELQQGARVSGNISYSKLQMECGANIEGHLVHTQATLAPAQAKIPAAQAAQAAPVAPYVISPAAAAQAEGDSKPVRGTK